MSLPAVGRRTAIALALALAAGGWRGALAASDSVILVSGELAKEGPGDPPGLYASADFALHLPEQASETLRRGVPLNFVYEFQLFKKKWYWANKEIASVRMRKRLTYSLISRRYLVSVGDEGLSLSYPSLEAALAVVSSVSRWRVAEADAITGKFRDYSARIQLSLDTSQLPRPLLIGAGDWRLGSDWVSLPISPAAEAP